MLAGGVHRLRKCLKQSLYHMVRLISVKQLQMQVATGFIRESLKKLPRQPKAKGARHVLLLFLPAQFLVSEIVQTTPDQIRPAAEINHTSRQTFVHRHVSLTRERILRMKTVPVTPNPPFIAQRLHERLSQGYSAILYRVMRIHF